MVSFTRVEILEKGMLEVTENKKAGLTPQSTGDINSKLLKYSP